VKGKAMSDKIMGRDWSEIQAMQQRDSTCRAIDTSAPGDYGADPLGDGLFRMVPSGDVVDFTERCKRLKT